MRQDGDAMRWTLLTSLTAFAITLAIIIGQRLSADALAVILGIAIGVAASLPGQLLFFKLIRLNPAPVQPSPPSTLHIPTSPAHPVLRNFVVIGDEANELWSPIDP